MFLRQLEDSASSATDDSSAFAQFLGYLVGAGSLALYTPIAFRVLRQKSADGLTLSTWWIKIASYACSDIYNFTHGYPLSAWADTFVITVEALVVLVLVAHYQGKMDATFMATGLVFCAAAGGLAAAPPGAIALGQASAAILAVVALLPQFALNYRLQTAGDYSPVTAGLASVGNAIRLFTTVKLAGSDTLLLASYGIAFLFNSFLLGQIVWYGVRVEGRGLASVLMADLGVSSEPPDQVDTSDLISSEPPDQADTSDLKVCSNRKVV